MTEQTNDVATIAKKITAIMADMPRMVKDSRNPHHKYDYTSIQHLASVMQPRLAKHGLAIVPAIESVVKDGDTRIIQGYMLLICADTGATLKVPWAGEGKDTQDKGVNKAVRAAQKYFAFATFWTSDADEEDADHGPEPKQEEEETEPFTPVAQTLKTRKNGKDMLPPDKVREQLRGRGKWRKTPQGLQREHENVQPIQTETKQTVIATFRTALTFDNATPEEEKGNAATLLEWLFDVSNPASLTEAEGQSVIYLWTDGKGGLNDYAVSEANLCLGAALEGKEEK